MRGPIAGRMQYPLVEQTDGDVYLEPGNLVLVTGQLRFGSGEDVNLYRGAADILRTDDAFWVGGDFRANAVRCSISGGNGVWSQDGTLQLLTGNGIRFGDPADLTVSRAAADVLGLAAGDGIQFGEAAADLAAPAANEVRLYAKDNGAGKTQLVARFNTGPVQVIATEP